MTYLTGALLAATAVEAAAIAALMLERARRGKAELALRLSEERFRLMADTAPAMIWTARTDTTLDFLNRTCVEFTGRPLDDLLNEGWQNVVHPDDLAHCINIYVPAFEARRPFLMEYRVRDAAGEYRWVIAHGVPKFARDGSFAGYIGCDVDITERRAAEDRIRESQAALALSHREIQHLAGRLIEAQDAERARIARDLHDDVSQQLAGMSIAFSGLRQRLLESQVGDDLQGELRALQQRTSTLAQNVRHLSHDLHPTVLRHVGLVPALSAYCAEIGRAHGTAVTCRAGGDMGSISAPSALCLYRVAQEAIRNVVAHAGASRASVELSRIGDRAEMTIADDGRGFEYANALERSKGLGLVSIAERVRLAGGTLEISTGPATGTRVTVQVPAGQAAQAASAADEGLVA